MASTTIQTASSSSSKPQPEYEVFLSFRGGDTRDNFTDHLYHALDGKGIFTFRDDKELVMGHPISQELLSAIEKSRMAVIILSQNYASSTWCLEELAKIVECMEGGILRVLPIFYHVVPSDVRHQEGNFATAFAKHENDFKEDMEKMEKVQKWKDALTKVANLSGKHIMAGKHSLNFLS